MSKNLYKNNDLAMSAFLITKGMKLIKVDKESRRADFIFEDNPNRKELCEKYFNGGELVEPRKYVLAIKDLKQILYSNY